MKSILVIPELEIIENEKLRKALEDKYTEYMINWIYPDEGNYPVEKIKAFINSIATKSNSSSQKLIHIFAIGNKLSHIVQNTLLKTLEETSHNILILVSNQNLLLPTVRSRMQIEYLNVDSESIAEEFNTKKISELSKETRENVLKFITSKINSYNSISNESVKEVLIYQEMFEKIKANCKIEAVLMEGLKRIGK